VPDLAVMDEERDRSQGQAVRALRSFTPSLEPIPRPLAGLLDTDSTPTGRGLTVGSGKSRKLRPFRARVSNSRLDMPTPSDDKQ
jgi:hypothetical protein